MDLTAYRHDFDSIATARGLLREEIVATAAGPVAAWSTGTTGPCIYISSGIHGDEPAGPLALLELLRGGAFPPDRRWVLCPLLNPTGLAAGTRDNAAGIDLNRDYLQRRSREVAAHAAWLEQRGAPDLFLSLHEDWETSGFYFYEINLGADDPNRARRIVAAVSAWLPPEPSAIIDDHAVREAGWIYHAAEADLPNHWPEAIFLAKLGCPLSFTFETPSRQPLAARMSAHLAAVQAAIA
jgi:predicted deacylase